MYVLNITACLRYKFYIVQNFRSFAKNPKYQCFLPIPVSNVIPAAVILMEALHSPHVLRALLEGQAWLRWLISVMDI